MGGRAVLLLAEVKNEERNGEIAWAKRGINVGAWVGICLFKGKRGDTWHD